MSATATAISGAPITAHAAPPPARLGLLLMPLAVALFIAIGLAVGTPSTNDSAAQLLKDWHDDVRTAMAFVEFAVGLMLAGFAASLVGTLRRAGDASTWPLVALIGGASLSVGVFVDSNLSLFITDLADKGDGAAVKTFALLQQDLFMAMVGGLALLLIGMGASALRTGALPKALAYVAIVLGVIAPVGPGGFATFVLGSLVLAASAVVLYRRAGSASSLETPAA